MMLRTMFLRMSLFIILAALVLHRPLPAQPSGSTQALSVQYEELTAPQFLQAVKQAGGTCVLPFGVLEKHGPHLPLGTDLLDAREVALRAAKQEYTLVYPAYYFGQIFEAKHQPGTIAYSHETIWNLLQETCDELARNGIRKIIIMNGHGGNAHFLRYFCQAQLEQRKNYAVVLHSPATDPELAKQVREMRQTTTGGHADEVETAMMRANRPELVHLEAADDQSGADQDRLDLPGTFTGIWWYAKYPNHYAGDGSPATRELGEVVLSGQAAQLAATIRAVKQADNLLELQTRFYDQSEHPAKTAQPVE